MLGGTNMESALEASESRFPGPLPVFPRERPRGLDTPARA
jgi:hypothetical protein